MAGNPNPGWEVVMDDDGVMARVRWSEPGEGGAYLYVRHYPATAWGKNAAENEAKTFNQIGKRPESFCSFRPKKIGVTGG